MKNNNITDFDNYKENMMSDMSGIEYIDDDMINAYLNATDFETPDLWERIDAGVEPQFEEIRRNEEAARRKRTAKAIGFVAAAAVLVVIATPLLFRGGIGDKSESVNDSHMTESTTEASMYESAAEDGDAYMEDVCEDTQSATEAESLVQDNEAGENLEGETTGQEPVTDVGTQNNNQSNQPDDTTVTEDGATAQEKADERKLIIKGKPMKLDKNIVGYGIVVEEIVTNEYEEYDDIEIGEVVVVSNSHVLENIYDTIECCQVELQNVYVNDNGRKQGKIFDIEIIEVGFSY